MGSRLRHQYDQSTNSGVRPMGASLATRIKPRGQCLRAAEARVKRSTSLGDGSTAPRSLFALDARHPLPKVLVARPPHTPIDSLLRAGVSTITLRGIIDASGRPPLSVTQDGVTISGGRIVSGSFYSGGESMNAALIVRFRCDHIGVTRRPDR